MRISAFDPSARLQPFVRSISVMETDVAEESAVLPAAGLMLGFRYAGAATLFGPDGARPVANAGLVGVRNTLRRMQTSARGGIVVTAFTELGAVQFFDQPLHEWFGGMVALDDVWSRAEFRELEERLAEVRTSEARVALVDAFLCRRLREREPDGTGRRRGSGAPPRGWSPSHRRTRERARYQPRSARKALSSRGRRVTEAARQHLALPARGLGLRARRVADVARA